MSFKFEDTAFTPSKLVLEDTSKDWLNGDLPNASASYIYFPRLGSNLKDVNLKNYHIDYSYPFDFEKYFQPRNMIETMQELYWVPWLACPTYCLVVYFLQRYMTNKAPLQLNTSLVLWNSALAIFSIWGSLRTLPELFFMLNHYGFSSSVCLANTAPFLENRIYGLWVWLFAVSKLFELGDTLFLVLRKRNVIFLHWYHHALTLFYTWTFYHTYLSTARWCIVMNYTIHAFMYSYYTIAALKIVKIPKAVSMSLTIAQISQMMMGLFIHVYAYHVKKAKNECHISDSEIRTSLFIYLSYFMLFVYFFHQAYFSGSKKSKEAEKKKEL